LLSIEQPDYQIAAAAGMHPTTLSNYAQGKADMSAKHLQALCELFQCEPEEIMGTMEAEIA
jgi:transcriptional regulator with XRE-family HTH domain